MYYSPLRYPGGKAKLTPFIGYVIDELQLNGGTYIEPFAGGAAIAIELLLTNKVGHIVINDYDKALASFWRSIIYDTDRFIEKMYETPITIQEWYKEREILLKSSKMSFELGFATFYLNRTNRSGILKGGPIGGKDQNGAWKLDARFNKESLAKRIIAIGERNKDISVYNQDVNIFVRKYLPQYREKALVYFDPPYFNKGSELYMNYFDVDDHREIEHTIKESLDCNWLMTYDDTDVIRKIYDGYGQKNFNLTYSVSKKRSASELMIFPKQFHCPTNGELKNKGIAFRFNE